MVSCFSTAVVIARRSERSTREYHLSLSEEPLILNDVFRLEILQRVVALQSRRAHGRWNGDIHAYSYDLATSDGNELVTYHWNRQLRGGVHYPHIHIGRSLAHSALPSPFRRQVSQLSKAHLPTNLVSLAWILESMVTDLGVTPLRDDWADILETAEAALRIPLPPEAPHVR